MGHGTPPAVEERWDDVIADAEATAEEYREAGYEALVIHSGDVTPLPDELALSVLAPGDEFEELEALVEGIEIDEVAVYSAEDGEVTFAVVVAEDADAEVAVCCPVFVHRTVAEALGDRAREAGQVNVRVRPLSDDSHVTVTVEEPDLLF